jgi:tetratricopeptide (TPR) repeat protein
MLFWSNEELPDGWDMNFLAQFSPVLRLPLLGMGGLLPLAFLGALTSFRGNRDVRLLVWFVVSYSASVIAFFLFSRYRLHVVPPLTVLAALGVQWIWLKIKERDYCLLTTRLLLSTLVALFAFFGVPVMAVEHREWSGNYVDLAKLYLDKSDVQNAESLLIKAVQLEPNRAETQCLLGWIKQQSGHHQAAVAYFDRCLQLDGSLPDAWYLLGKSYESLQDVEAAVSSYKNQISLVPGHDLSVKRLRILENKHAERTKAR